MSQSFKMHCLSTAVIFFAIYMLQVSSHVTPLEYSSLTPWTSVYAIYPIYSPETYDIWKNDPSIHLPENVISWISWKNNDQKKTKLYPENTDVTINETTKSKQNEKFNSVIESGLNLSGQIRDNSWPRRNRDEPTNKDENKF